MRVPGLLSAAVVAIGIAAGCWAQSDTGGVVWGRVAGPGDQAVSGAEVQLVNAATGEQSSARSDAEGNFHFAEVMPGAYRVVVQARSDGLSDWEADNLTVGVGTTARLTARLTPRTLHHTVLVDARRVSDGAADPGGEMGDTWLDALPNNGQHYADLAGLFGAASPDGNGELSFQGLSPLMNSVALDGTNTTLAFRSRERGTDGNGFATGQSAVGLFQTSTYGDSAEHGRGGAAIETVTKSGSSHMRGQAVFFDRGAIGQARNAYSKVMQAEPAGTTATGEPVQYLNGQPITYVDVPVHMPDRRQEWEVSAGGPVGPRGRERAFWFFSWEEHNRHDPAIARASEPEVFFFPASEPSLTVLEARLARSTTANPLVKDCPIANGAPDGSTAAAECAYSAVLNQLSGMLGSVPRSTMQTNLFQKITWRVSTRNALDLQYGEMRRTAPHGALSGASEMDAVGSFADSSTSDDDAVARWDFFARPQLLNSLRLQYSRDVLAQRARTPSAFEQPWAKNTYGLAPQIAIDRSAGFTFGTLANANKREYPAETRWQLADAATWIHGRAAVRWGYDFNHVRDALDGMNGENGEYSYASVVDFVSDLLAPDSCDGGAAAAGPYPCYERFRQTLGPSKWWFSTEDYAAFAAGEWKIGHSITLTAGLRYDYERLPDTNAALVNPAIPETARLPHNRDDFGPRAGMAWDVFGRDKTMLRGGVGIDYARTPNAMVFSALTATGSAHSPRTYSWRPMDAGAPPFPYVFASNETPYVDPKEPDQASTAPQAVYFDPHFQHPRIIEADVELQQALGGRMVLTLTGMATDGHRLTQFVDANIDQNDWADMFYSVEGPNSGGETGPLGKTASPSGSAFPIYAVERFYYRRLNPAYGSMTDIASETNSSYRGAMVRLVRRMSRTLSINAGYTWAHAIDDGQNEATFAEKNDVYDPADPRLEHGTSNFDVRQRAAGGMVIAEPWRLRGAANLLLGGYSLSGTGEWRTGLPYSMRTMGSTPTPSCSYQDWLAAGGATGNGADCLKAVRQPNATFDSGSAAVPIAGLGASLNGSGGEDLIVPVGRNTFRYPEATNLDLRFTKRIRLSDRYSWEVMAEAFNALNHPNVTNIQTVGYRLSNDTVHANMAKLIWQSGMKPGSTVQLVNGTKVTDPVFDETAAFGGTTNTNSRMLSRERQIQAGIRLFF